MSDVLARQGSPEKAMEKSCKRNRMEIEKGKRAANTNTVLFGQQHGKRQLVLSMPMGGETDRCGAYFNDLWVCKNVPSIIPEDDCLKNWNTVRPPCKSCKSTYGQANQFYVEVLKQSAHLEYQKPYMQMANGEWKQIDTRNC